jgi:LemA protein
MTAFILIVVIVLALVLILGVSVIAMYNRFVSQRNVIEESWRQIDVELRRRYDLIPQLVETVKGYASHERQVLTELSRLRSQAVSGPSRPSAQRAQTEEAISGQLRQLMVSVEAYPQLQSNQNFLQLQQTLADTEDRIAAGRRFYNANVRAYNTRLATFPSSIIGGAFHHAPAEYFDIQDEEARQMPQVSFDTGSYGSQPVQEYAPSQVGPPSEQATPALDAAGQENPVPGFGDPRQAEPPSATQPRQGTGEAPPPLSSS